MSRDSFVVGNVVVLRRGKVVEEATGWPRKFPDERTAQDWMERQEDGATLVVARVIAAPAPEPVPRNA